MNNSEPIIVIDGDRDKQYLMGEVFLRLNYKNKIIYFEDGAQAFEYLISSNERPFLIISDVNTARLTGLELKEKINSDEKLRLKCIPYIFLTTSALPSDIMNVYSNFVQGFFVKPNSMDTLSNTIKIIMEYWKQCIAPSEYD